MKKKQIASCILALLLFFTPQTYVLADSIAKNSPFFNVDIKQTSETTIKIDDPDSILTSTKFIDKFVLGTTFRHGEDPTKVLQELGVLADDFNFKPDAKMKRIDALNIAMRSLGYYGTKKEILEKAASEGIINSNAKSEANFSDDKFISEIEATYLINNYKNNIELKRDKTVVPQRKVEDFLKPVESFGYAISPDGTALVYLAPVNNVVNLFIKRLDNGKVLQLTFSKDEDISSPSIKNDKILYSKDSGGNENYHIYSVDIDGTEKDLTPYKDTVARIVNLNSAEKESDEIIIAMNKDNKQYFSLYTLNVKTGETKIYFENSKGYTNFIFDSKEQLTVVEKNTGLTYEYYYRKNNKEQFKLIKSFSKEGAFSILFFGPDNKIGYALSDVGTNTNALIKLNIPTGEIIETIYTNPNVDLYTLIEGTDNFSIGGVVFITDKPNVKFFDKKLKAVYDKILTHFSKDEFISIGNYTDDFNKFVVISTSDVNRGKYFLYDYKANKLDKITDLNYIPSKELAKMTPISYKTSDGVTIYGYLTLPRGVKAEKLPLIVNPHGGPWARDYWAYNYEAQMLANRGYAVLQMNFRGSTGYGKDFTNKGNKQWGLKMQDDITDGVNWLISLGVIDKDKIGIYGASYGGYATLEGITKTPDMYKVAVDYVGVSNLITFLQSIPSYWEFQRNLLYERVGDPVKDKEQLEATSPALHADKIKTPVFIAYGLNDPRVNKSESEQIIQALKKNNVPYESLVKDNEGHGFYKYENQVEFYTKITKFLDKYLKK